MPGDSTQTNLPAVGSRIKVWTDGAQREGRVTGHSQKDGKPIVDFIGQIKLSSGKLSQSTTLWCWPEQILKQTEFEVLQEKYIDAASELRAVQAAMQNHSRELHAFIAIRDQLRQHPDFSGALPITFFTGSGLDPLPANTD
jgi:hypothetical protein